MNADTQSSTQVLLHSLVVQVWTHDWGYIIFAGVLLAIDAAATEWFRASRRRKTWRRW